LLRSALFPYTTLFRSGGTLSSLNDNMNFDLNAGDLYMDKASFTMRNANFYLGGGANIVFEDPGNKIYYNILGPNTYYRTSGMGVDRQSTRLNSSHVAT